MNISARTFLGGSIFFFLVLTTPAVSRGAERTLVPETKNGPSIVFEAFLKIPVDAENPHLGSREAHLIVESIPVFDKKGALKECVYRWSDRRGAGHPPFKLRVKDWFTRIVLNVFRGTDFVLVHKEPKEDRASCGKPLKKLTQKMSILNHLEQEVGTVTVLMYDPTSEDPPLPPRNDK